MGLVETNGIILRTVDFGETDRYLSVLSPDIGMVEVLAKNARKAKRALLRSSEVFTLGTFILFEKSGNYRLNTISLIEGFAGLRNDIERLTCAAHLAEVFVDIGRGEVEAGELYRLAVYALYALARSDGPEPFDIVRAAETRALALAGYRFHLDHCGRCGVDVSAEDSVLFSLGDCQPVCEDPMCRKAEAAYYAHHAGRRLYPLSRGARTALEFFADAPYEKLFRFSLTDRVRRELNDLLPPYLSGRLERGFHKLDFLLKL